MTLMLPFTKMVDLANGTIPGGQDIQVRHLADLKGLFADSAAESALLPENPVIYRVYLGAHQPEVVGQLSFSTTVIYPGKVGEEYFFTKGHYHAKGDRAELYFCLRGEGILLLQTREGEVNVQHMTPGAAALVPPYWGHRTINTGQDEFAFFACYPSDAGYDYAAIAEKGFASLIVERDGKTEMIPNPSWL